MAAVCGGGGVSPLRCGDQRIRERQTDSSKNMLWGLGLNEILSGIISNNLFFTLVTSVRQHQLPMGAGMLQRFFVMVPNASSLSCWLAGLVDMRSDPLLGIWAM